MLVRSTKRGSPTTRPAWKPKNATRSAGWNFQSGNGQSINSKPKASHSTDSSTAAASLDLGTLLSFMTTSGSRRGARVRASDGEARPFSEKCTVSSYMFAQATVWILNACHAALLAKPTLRPTVVRPPARLIRVSFRLHRVGGGQIASAFASRRYHGHAVAGCVRVEQLSRQCTHARILLAHRLPTAGTVSTIRRTGASVAHRPTVNAAATRL